MKYKSTCLASLVLSFVGLFAVICPSANATYTATLNEVGSNVVGTGSGLLDTTDLTFLANFADNPQVAPNNGTLLLGSVPGGPFDGYHFVSGPTNFGSGSKTNADSGSGNFVGIVAFVSILDVPDNYVSGTPLGVSTNTWNNASFASLGLTPGTYVWNWGSGIHADSFTLQIGPANVPETGSTIALMLGAVGTLIAFRQKLLVRS